MGSRAPLFFFHLPKTAGSSLQGVLSKHFAPDEIAPAVTWTTLLHQDRRKLAQCKLFQGHFYGPLEKLVGQRCITFTILRDPLERALSHYGHVLRDKHHYLHRRALELGSIEAYIDDPITRMTISNFQSRMLALEFDVEAYFQNLTEAERQAWALELHMETSDLGPKGDQLLTAARAKLETFDAVGITERFPQTLALLCYRRRWKYPIGIVAQNVNAQRITQSELSPGTVQRLKELNDVDIALYSTARSMLESSCHEMLVDLVNRRAYEGLRRLLLG